MKLAVFCGSSSGHDDVFRRATVRFGQEMVIRNIDLVYGGGNVGLMGVIADTVLSQGGKAYGVIPTSLAARELAHPGLTQLDVVDSMHERKARMAELADAFVALPGGPGTMDEIFEAWTWAQLGYHHKPCAFYNVNGYYDKLFDFIDSMQREGFLRPVYLELMKRESEAGTLLDGLMLAARRPQGT